MNRRLSHSISIEAPGLSLLREMDAMVPITVHQNVDVWAARLSPEEQAVFRSKPNRRAWIQMARGAGMLNRTLLRAGDGAAASQEEMLEIKAVDDAEFLMFDLS
jgi:quercetin 2,3-dioxygenase